MLCVCACVCVLIDCARRGLTRAQGAAAAAGAAAEMVLAAVARLEKSRRWVRFRPPCVPRLTPGCPLLLQLRDEVRTLRAQLQQRDSEIAILVSRA